MEKKLGIDGKKCWIQVRSTQHFQAVASNYVWILVRFPFYSPWLFTQKNLPIFGNFVHSFFTIFFFFFCFLPASYIKNVRDSFFHPSLHDTICLSARIPQSRPTMNPERSKEKNERFFNSGIIEELIGFPVLSTIYLKGVFRLYFFVCSIRWCTFFRWVFLFPKNTRK